jgi:hypothetical protein
MASRDITLTVQQGNQKLLRQFIGSSEDMYGRDFRDVPHPSVQQPSVRRFPASLQGRHQQFVVPVTAMGSGEKSASAVSLTEFGGAGWPVRHVCCPSARRLAVMDARIIEGIAAGCFSRQGVECHVTCLPPKAAVTRRRRHRAGRLRTLTSWRPGHGGLGHPVHGRRCEVRPARGRAQRSLRPALRCVSPSLPYEAQEHSTA